MEAYNILNTIKPNFLVSKFPYNLVNPAKIILTKKKISIIVKQLKLSHKQKAEGGAQRSTNAETSAAFEKVDNRIVLYG
jgi:hypothetical protein